uniref:uncharacterized protein LOC122596352 n=1 Tax=Erigeron canadensis TaxID=72917 RepID=UPI001CB9AC2C|nr:uncharacterized protein LOC122596352 [Erigeron canadensis]
MLDLNPHQFSNNQADHNSHNYYFNHHANNNYYRSFNNDNFRLETRDEEEEEVSSPPLWRTNYISSVEDPRALSPASRAQAIARGQRELMEMVENMPETSYELSLKDMVDHHQQRELFNHESISMEEDQERSILGRGSDDNYYSQADDSQRWNNKKSNKKGSVKRQGSSGSNKTGRIIVKNGSINRNEGLLINMFFPFSTSFGTKKRKSTNSVKFSLKPEELFIEKSSGGRDWWWWKKYKGGSSSGDSESLGITSSSAGESTGRSGSSGSSGGGSLRSNSDRNKNGCKYGCWSFFPSRKKKMIMSSPDH